MEQNNQNLDSDFRADAEHIRRDVKRVILGNLLFLALLIGLYFANQQYAVLSKLEKLF